MVVNKDLSVRRLKLTLGSRGFELESPQGLTKFSMPTKLYSNQSPAQSTTSLSDDDDDELDKSLYFVEPASPTKWTKEQEKASFRQSLDANSIVARLPPEVLIHIFKQLHNPRDLLSCLLVSRIWAACSVELLWHKPHFPRSTSLYQLVSILSRLSQDLMFTYPLFVRRLNFLQMGQDLNSSVFVRLAACERLERLTLNNCNGITDDALLAVLPCWPNLVALDLTNVSETTDRAIIAFANTTRRLQGLNLGMCKNVTDEGIIAIAKSSPHLRRIKLGHLELITDKSVIALAVSCPLLLEVDLNSCSQVTDASVREIWTHSVHMREFRLAYCQNLTDSAFPAPPRPPVGPDPFPNSTSVPTQQWPPLELKHPFEHLRILDLTSCQNITDDAIEGIVSNARKIRNLVLGKCVRLTDAALESICKLGKSLHYLHLGHTVSITDRSVTNLARSCLRLRYIDLACCPLLTDLSVLELASLPKLRRIGLVRVVNLTDQAVMNLGEQRRHTLERIHLSYCEQITVSAIHFLLQKVTKLTHLSLTGVPSFRHTELQQFCRPAPREFNATQRSAFCVYSNDGVRDLRKYLQNIMPPIGDDEVNESYEREDEQSPVFQSGYVEDSEQDEYTNVSQTASHARTNVAPRRRHSHSHANGFEQANTPPVVEAIEIPPNAPEWDGDHDTTRSSRRSTRNHTFQHVTTRRPARSASNSARSSQSNGIGFMTTYDPAAMQMQAEWASMNGTATPELVFAEIGHGAGPGPGTLATSLEHQLPIDEDGTPFGDDWVVRERPDTPVATIPEASRSTPSLHDRRFHRGGLGGRAASPSSAPGASSSRQNSSNRADLSEELQGLRLNDGSHWEDDGRGGRSGFSSGLIHTFRNVGLLSSGRRGRSVSNGGSSAVLPQTRTSRTAGQR